MHSADLSPTVIAWVVLAFMLGGMVKGTLGIGLPLVVVPLLSLQVGPALAIVWVAVPVLASNIWQFKDSPEPLSQVRRFMPMLVASAITTAITVPMTLALSARALNVMLAGALLLAIFLLAVNPRLNISARHEKWASAAVGGFSGILGGISSLTGPIIVTYLMALRLPREVFVGTISAIYLCTSSILYLAMALVGRFQWVDLAVSALAMVPVFAGLALGKRLRQHLSEELFRRLLLAFLSLIALVLLFK